MRKARGFGYKLSSEYSQPTSLLFKQHVSRLELFYRLFLSHAKVNSMDWEQRNDFGNGTSDGLIILDTTEHIFDVKKSRSRLQRSDKGRNKETKWNWADDGLCWTFICWFWGYKLDFYLRFIDFVQLVSSIACVCTKRVHYETRLDTKNRFVVTVLCSGW